MAQHVLITGAAGNLGHAVAEKFLNENWQVTGTVMPGEKVKLKHESLTVEEIDLGNEKKVAALIDQASVIDVAVLTVGGFAMGDIEETSADDMRKQIDLNFFTAWHIIRPLFMAMKKRNAGRIFLIGSKPGLNPVKGKGLTAYGIAKSMIFYLAGMMNAEAEGTNVVTSVIVPSIIDTPANRKSMPKEDFSSWVEPSSIAEVIYLYAGDKMKTVREPIIKVYNNA